ncbi:MAG: hypothetical protein GF331_09470, partial [Chitinivibrionales bacterium]|nr:hypothetical protein [Chitinivibrionales bacterium]
GMHLPDVRITECRTRPFAPRPDGPWATCPESTLAAQDTRIGGDVNERIRWARREIALRRALEPVVHEQLERPTPDVIVGANDDVAIAVLDVLLARGLSVPDDCAVVGFDDSPMAEPAQLTSYSFNAPAVVLEALRYGQTCPERTGPCRELLVDGFVVRRRTG